MSVKKSFSGFSTAESRWSRFGPYYAMFPIDFAFRIVGKYSKKGDKVLDPFAGRGSSIYAAATTDRQGIGIEINPVGWLYGSVKLNPAKEKAVLKRLKEINFQSKKYAEDARSMSQFFRLCFCFEVRKFLLSARNCLDWKNNNVDATLMAIILVNLHGKLGEGLSNQMRQTKAMSVKYSINWWKQNGFNKPPKINPESFIRQKIAWRYAKGFCSLSKNNKILLGDSTKKLKMMRNRKFSLLFTSPPYFSVTNYHADQWLRLWMLGNDPTPKSRNEKNCGRFGSKEDYFNMLDSVFKYSSKLMNKNSTIYVRTDSRKFTFETTLVLLKKYFPKHQVKIIKRPVKNKTQTHLFKNNPLHKKGEIDILMTNR